jgi:argininosuccinate synthase
MERIVLAHGGGFDVAAAIASLKARYGADIIAVTMDLGQGHVFEELRDRALAGGASRAHVLDLRETFASSYVLPSLKADALDAGGVPLPSSLARAVIADKLVEMAAIEQASAVAHVASAADGGGAVLDTAIRAVNPSLEVITVDSHTGTGDEAAACVTVNLWGRTIARPAGTELPERLYKLTRPVASAPAEAATIELQFERGVPVSVNRVPMPLVELIATVAHLAGAHGVGRMQTANAVVEAPAAAVLHLAHRAVPGGQPSGAERDRVRRQYADIIAGGEWATAARAALDKKVNKWQQRANGAVRLRVFRGECHSVTHAD